MRHAGGRAEARPRLGTDAGVRPSRPRRRRGTRWRDVTGPGGHGRATRRLRDEQLVALARGGDATAFEELVRRHQERVYRVALRLLNDPDDAEDAAQEAFVGAWLGLPRFRADSGFGTWLYRIVTNRCLNVRRARAAAGRTVVPFEEGDAAPTASAAGPEEMAAGRDELEDLRRAIAALTPEQRAAFVLCELEGCSQEEAARILETTVSAVKSRVHRARRELLRALRAAPEGLP